MAIQHTSRGHDAFPNEPHQFLCLVESKVLAVDGSLFVKVSSTDYTRFRPLERGTPIVQETKNWWL